MMELELDCLEKVKQDNKGGAQMEILYLFISIDQPQ